MADFDTDLKIICLETEAFYQLTEAVVERVMEKYEINEKPWLTEEEAQELLPVTAKSTWQKYRNEGLIEFSQPSKKVLLYSRESIMQFIAKHKRKAI